MARYGAVEVDVREAGGHSSIIPVGLDHLFAQVMSEAGMEGFYQVIMGRSIYGSSFTQGVAVKQVLTYGILCRAQPGDNSTRRICTIQLNGYDSQSREEIFQKLDQACKRLFNTQTGMEEAPLEPKPVEPDFSTGFVLPTSEMDTTPHDVLLPDHSETSEFSHTPVIDHEQLETEEEGEPEESSSTSWRNTLQDALTDNNYIAMILAEVERSMLARQNEHVSSHELTKVIRDHLVLGEQTGAPVWASRRFVEGLIRRDLITEIPHDGNQRVSAYCVSPDGLELIERELKISFPKRVPLPAPAPASETSAPPVVIEAPTTETTASSNPFAMLADLKARSEAYRIAKAGHEENFEEVGRILTMIDQLNEQVETLQKRKVALETKMAEQEAVIYNPANRSAFDELKLLLEQFETARKSLGL